MSWLLRQELLKSQGASTIVLLTLGLPGGTKRYVAGPGTALLGTGQYESKLLDLGSLPRSMSDRNGSMQAVEYDAVIDDTDDTFSAIVEGSSARSIRGSTATRTLGSPNVSSANWFTTFDGVIDRYALDGPKRWKITVRPNDLSLRNFYPKMSIDKADWPNAPDDSLAQYGPLLYGKHDTKSTGTGAVPLILVDSKNFKYLVCWGQAMGVDRVFADGATPAGSWSVDYNLMNNGRGVTVVNFTVDQGTKAITADVRGYDTVGNRSGTLIENPADQIKHLLTNFIFNDYKNGTDNDQKWFADSMAPIDAESFLRARNYFSLFGALGSRRIFGGQIHGIDTVNEWAQSWEAKLFWTHRGKIGLSLIPPQIREIYSNYAYLRYDDNQQRGAFPINLRPDWETLIDRVQLQYEYIEAQGKYIRTLEVRDPGLIVEAPDSLSLQWSAAYE